MGLFCGIRGVGDPPQCFGMWKLEIRSATLRPFLTIQLALFQSQRHDMLQKIATKQGFGYYFSRFFSLVMYPLVCTLFCFEWPC